MSKKRAFGVIPGPRDVRNYRAVCAAAETDFPEEFEIEDLPEPGDQGEGFACAAFAMITIMEHHSRRQGDYSGRLSPWYLYAYRSNNYTGKGRHDEVILRDARKVGTVPYDRFPHEMEVPEIIERLNENFIALHPEAYPFRITSSYELNGNSAMKADLIRGNPIYISVEWYDDIEVDGDGVIQTSRVPSGNYHALVIYGWDKRGWKIQNSWGTDWGINGRAIWPYGVPMRRIFGVSDEYSEAQQIRERELYKSRVAELEAKIEENTISFEQMEAEIAAKETKILELQEKALKLETAMNEKNALEQEVAELEQSLKTAQDLSAKEVAALKAQLLSHQTTISALEANAEEYVSVIRQLNTEAKSHKDCGDKLQELADENERLWAELEAKDKELDAMEQQNLEIKKPYSSDIGQIVAKILNFLLNLFDK